MTKTVNKKKYPMFSCRLRKETSTELKRRQKESGEVWDKFIKQLLTQKHEKENSDKH